MKAILIDALNKEIKELSLEDGSLERIVEALQVNLIESAPIPLPISEIVQDIMYVDEEGMINGTNYGFFIKNLDGMIQTIYGNALVIGIDEDGNSIDCLSSLPQIEGQVISWCNITN